MNLTQQQKNRITTVLTDYCILRTTTPTKYPSDWPKYYNASSEACDVLIGPCVCSAYHGIDEWWDRFGLETPTFHSLKGTAISSGEARQ